MKRLFVDCDDTLVLWLNEDGEPLEGQNPYGGGSDRWEPNTALIDAVGGALTADPDLRLVVWSGGGHQYAEVWANRLLPGRWSLCATKMLDLPQPDDLCVDDADIIPPSGARVVTWQQYVEAQR